MFPERYPLLMRILHWTMALLILGMIAAGLYMTSLPEEDPSRMQIYGLHKSFGVLVLLLVFVRVLVRLRSTVPPLPEKIPQTEAVLARLGHFVLYLLIFAVPLAGIAMSNSFGYPVEFFGLALPFSFPENKEIASLFAEAHELLAFGLLAIVGIHVLAVIKHRVKDHVNLLSRMWK